MVNKMKEFIITTDTTCDLPIEYIEEHNIKVLPLYYSFDNTVYGDKINLDIKEFYDKMRSGNMPTTMAVNPDTARNIFKFSQ